MSKTTLMTPVESMATRVALHPLLAGMKRRHLTLLTSCAEPVQFKKGQVVFREGELADGIYLIETGKLIWESRFGAGDPLLWWMCLFPLLPRPFTARALEPTTALFLDGIILREYCDRDHSLGYELLKRVSLEMYGRMRAARNEMLTIRRSANTQPAQLSSFVDRERAASGRGR